MGTAYINPKTGDVSILEPSEVEEYYGWLSAKEYVESLKSELRWAWENLPLASQRGDDEIEYDFCNVCGFPEWRHSKNCKGLEHQKAAKELLDGK